MHARAEAPNALALPSLLSRLLSAFTCCLLTQRAWHFAKFGVHTLAIYNPPMRKPTSDVIGRSRPHLANWQLRIQPKCRARYETTAANKAAPRFCGGVSKRGRTCSLRLSLWSRFAALRIRVRRMDKVSGSD